MYFLFIFQVETTLKWRHIAFRDTNLKSGIRLCTEQESYPFCFLGVGSRKVTKRVRVVKTHGD